MKKSILIGACVLGFLFVGFYVIRENLKQVQLADLALENVDACAGDWNNWRDWIDQGFTKDEREHEVYSKREVEVALPDGTKSIYREERKVVTCPIGNENCTET